ncbi:MAG: hypothetical protein KGL43_25885 [Burkholderiales bacterium]|nr:hypothetical protein [Burkholderiales bacterium]
MKSIKNSGLHSGARTTAKAGSRSIAPLLGAALVCGFSANCLAADVDGEIADLKARLHALEEQAAAKPAPGAPAAAAQPNAIGNVKFNFWGRYMVGGYSNIPSVAANKDANGNVVNMDSQIRYKLKVSSQLQDNVWAYSVIGQDITYDTRTSSNFMPAANGGTAVGIQKMFTKIKFGDWTFNVGRQGANESDPASRLGTGLWLASSSGFDGVSVQYKIPNRPNSQFLFGAFTRGFGATVRNISLLNAYYDLLPGLNLTATYFADGTARATGSPAVNTGRAQIATVGANWQFGANRMWTLIGEIGDNRRAKDYLQAVGRGSEYSGKSTGWDLILKYNNADINVPGSWDVSADLRQYQPGFAPYAGTEWVGGVLSPSKMGINSGANTDNVKGLGAYFSYAPFKNVYTQVSVYDFAPVVQGSTDGKHRQALRLMFDYMY